MYYLYIIKSQCGRFYIGSTDNLENRLRQHNSKQFKGWTNRYDNWSLVYKESFNTRTEVLKREKVVKALKGGNEFKKLVGTHNPA